MLSRIFLCSRIVVVGLALGLGLPGCPSSDQTQPPAPSPTPETPKPEEPAPGEPEPGEPGEPGEPSGPVIAEGCKVGGCSSTLCVAADAEDPISTCEFRTEYACYRSARCEIQSGGECGWTATEELKACLANPPQAE